MLFKWIVCGSIICLDLIVHNSLYTNSLLLRSWNLVMLSTAEHMCFNSQQYKFGSESLCTVYALYRHSVCSGCMDLTKSISYCYH